MRKQYRQPRNQRTLIITVIAAAALLLSYQQTLASVTVLESTPSRLVLNWELTGFDTAAHTGAPSGKQISVYYDGGNIPTGDSGGAFIPAYSIHAGVPERGGVRVSVESPEFSVVRLSAPLRTRLTVTDTSAPRFVSQWVSEPRYGMLRGYRSAHVLLRPVRDMGRGRIQLLKRARIVFEFPPSAAHTGESWPPRGEYERMTARMLLNFRVAQGWHVSPGRGGLRKASRQSDAYPFALGQKLAVFKVGDGNRNLNEGLTNENSLIKIRGSAIRKVFGPQVRMSSVALYASRGGEMNSLVPPTPLDIPAGVYEVPLLRYDLNGDGNVDDGDYVVAYVSGASDWKFVKDEYGWRERYFDFSINRYDDSRTYWLAAKGAGDRGLEMGRYVQPPVNAAERGSYEAKLYLRTPQALSGLYNSHSDNHEGGLEWVWKIFTPSRADTTIRLDLPGIDRRAPGSISLRYGSSRISGGTFGAWLGSERLCSDCGEEENIVDDWGSNDLLIRFFGGTGIGPYYGELSAVYVRYSRPIALGGAFGKLEIFSDTDAGDARYRLSNDGGALAYIVRVPADGGDVELVDTTRASSYVWNDVGGEGVRYMAMLEKEIVDYSDSLAVPAASEISDARYQIRDLRDVSNSTDFLIITHADFLSAALKLAAHKAGMGFDRPKVVLLRDIMDQFGGGNTDPAAIRNFLYYVYWNWEGGGLFSFVTLMGTGHYDYKSIISRVPNFIPVPYVPYTFASISEDFYVFLDPTAHPNSQHYGYYFLGRMPARSLAEAFDIVDKVIETEDPRTADFDSWRGRMLLSVDDDQQGEKVDGTDPMHVESSERISRVIDRLRPDIDVRKIYLYEYRWDERYYKPAATRAFINEINSGVGVVNWFGHGSPAQLADERLFHKENISSLGNRKRYPIFTVFSCSVGKFDQPEGDESLSSELVRQPMGGGVAVLSSAREVYARNNEGLARPFFEVFLDTSDGARLSIGGALATAKAQYAYYGNRAYMLLGDPSIRILGRGRGVDLEVTDASGARLDTLKALQQVTIKGRVAGAGEDFGGAGAYAAVTLFNPPQDSTRRKDGGGGKNDTTVYSMPGSLVYSVKIPVVNGAFEQPIRLPMNLTFGKPGAKLTAYVWKERESAVGAGYIRGLVFDGSDNDGARSDTVGPKISVRPVYNNEAMDRAGLFVKNRITAQLPLTLEVAIEDSSGINVISSGPDEGLTMEVKGARSKHSINHLFRFSEGSFSQGTATLDFESNTLKSGTYEMVISAQDLLGNVSKLSVTWEVTDPSDIKLDHVMNVPNPVKMGQQTRFYYTHSDVAGLLDVNVTIRVYSLGGRLLSVIRNPQNGEAWVPMDSRRNYLTPNVYLYQVTATSHGVGKTVKSKIKKLAVLPPR